MNRRSFLGVAPLGILGIGAVAMNDEQPKSEIKKAKMIIITGEDGKQYHPLVVDHNETEHDSVNIPTRSPSFLFP